MWRRWGSVLVMWLLMLSMAACPGGDDDDVIGDDDEPTPDDDDATLDDDDSAAMADDDDSSSVADDDDSAADDDDADSCVTPAVLPPVAARPPPDANLASMIGVEQAEALEWALDLGAAVWLAGGFLNELAAVGAGLGDGQCPVGTCTEVQVPFPAQPPSPPATWSDTLTETTGLAGVCTSSGSWEVGGDALWTSVSAQQTSFGPSGSCPPPCYGEVSSTEVSVELDANTYSASQPSAPGMTFFGLDGTAQAALTTFSDDQVPYASSSTSAAFDLTVDSLGAVLGMPSHGERLLRPGTTILDFEVQANSVSEAYTYRTLEALGTATAHADTTPWVAALDFDGVVSFASPWGPPGGCASEPTTGGVTVERLSGPNGSLVWTVSIEFDGGTNCDGCGQVSLDGVPAGSFCGQQLGP